MENEEIKVEEVKEEVPAEEVKVEEIKEESKAPKKGKGGLIAIIVIGIILLIAINVVVALILINNDKNKNNTTTTTTVTTTEKTVFKVTFNSNGGDSIQDIEVKKDEKVTLPTPKKEGAEFLYWSDEEDVQYNETTTFDKDTNLTANWKDKNTKTLTVTFDSKGGSKVNSMKFVCTDNAAIIKNLPKPTKDSYEFRTWEDKHGTPILNEAKITCDGDLKLYAVWEYDGPTAAPELKCNIGTLDGENCVETKAAKTKCPDGTKADGDLCIKTSDSNTGTRVCKEDTVAYDGKGHTWTGRGDYYMVGNSYGKCAYYKWTSYTTKSACEAAYDVYHKTTWVSELNACYSETKVGNYETQCSSDYKWYTSSELSSKFGIHNDGRCLKKVDKTSYCDDGYTLKDNKCVKVLGKATPVE